MKRIFFNLAMISSIVIFYSGCGAVDYGQQCMELNNKNMLKISLGMSINQVSDVMGTTTIGDISNPYKVELYTQDNQEIKVLYYYTQRKVADGIISDDELTPFIFKNGLLVGMSQGTLNKVINTYEIRHR